MVGNQNGLQKATGSSSIGQIANGKWTLHVGAQLHISTTLSASSQVRDPGEAVAAAVVAHELVLKCVLSSCNNGSGL
jgi:hypothetical protein